MSVGIFRISSGEWPSDFFAFSGKSGALGFASGSTCFPPVGFCRLFTKRTDLGASRGVAERFGEAFAGAILGPIWKNIFSPQMGG